MPSPFSAGRNLRRAGRGCNVPDCSLPRPPLNLIVQGIHGGLFVYVRRIWGRPGSREESRSFRAGEQTGVAPTEPPKLTVFSPAWELKFPPGSQLLLFAFQRVVGFIRDPFSIFFFFLFFFFPLFLLKGFVCCELSFDIWVRPPRGKAVLGTVLAADLILLELLHLCWPLVWFVWNQTAPLKLSLSHWPGAEERLLQDVTSADPRAGPRPEGRLFPSNVPGDQS